MKTIYKHICCEFNHFLDYEPSVFCLLRRANRSRHDNDNALEWKRETGEAAALVSRVSQLHRSKLAYPGVGYHLPCPSRYESKRLRRK